MEPQEPTIWEVEVRWRGRHGVDPRAREIQAELEDWTGTAPSFVEVHDLYYLAGSGLGRDDAVRVARHLLGDPVIQDFALRVVDGEPRKAGEHAAGGQDDTPPSHHVATVFKKVGVMDPVEGSLRKGLEDLGIGMPPGGGEEGVSASTAVRVRTGHRITIGAPLDSETRRTVADKILSNPAIEDVYWDDAPIPSPFAPALPYRFERTEVTLEGLADEALEELSRRGQLSLSLDEMRCVRDHFRALGRAPTDVELETIAQTWSEHCCHKTLNATIVHNGARIENLFRETIRRATEEVMAGHEEPFCLSVFKDNAGVVAFDDAYGVSFKVETHNHPSAIEPYGGAGTGIGGVLRDTLGTGRGARPIVNTDVFCFGPPDFSRDGLPPGTLHPLRVLRGVVAGVRDYGNRMGIPTASGALFFDERYIGNPLVYCGSVGIIPRTLVSKAVEPGDRIFVLGGRTGRDGIHGATFSSVELHEESEVVSSGAVQIGNAITEKKLLDVLLQARDAGLYRAVTDCGAGGLSSAVGEMGADCGTAVELEGVPLKYEGLSYTEIWISEAQERMVLAVPPEHADALGELAASENVECTDIGEFTSTGRLELFYAGNPVADLDMAFLHHGRPQLVRTSSFEAPARENLDLSRAPRAGALLRSILRCPNVASKEWVIRQYDHEVQGCSVLKPLQGAEEDGPGDASVFAPRFGSLRGIAIGCGMNPCYGDLDPHRMALCALDEAVRNVVAVGADPRRIAVLDNFCWGNVQRPDALGALVETARGCYEGATLLGVPFISGKDSLNNEFRTQDGTLSIPPSLLISSVGIVEDVRSTVSMDLKAPGNRLVVVGMTRNELGGSHLAKVLGLDGGAVPDLDRRAREIHIAVHRAIASGLVLAAHDLSEGGLAVAAAEMAFSGAVGAEIRLADVPREGIGEAAGADLTVLFSESNCRYLLETAAEDVPRLLEHLAGLPAALVGSTLEYGILRFVGLDGLTVLAESLGDLKEAWQAPLSFGDVPHGAE